MSMHRVDTRTHRCNGLVLHASHARLIEMAYRPQLFLQYRFDPMAQLNDLGFRSQKDIGTSICTALHRQNLNYLTCWCL